MTVDQLLREHGPTTVLHAFSGAADHRGNAARCSTTSPVRSSPANPSPPTCSPAPPPARSSRAAAWGTTRSTSAAATARGIRVCNAPGINHHSVAELTIGLILMAARRLLAVTDRGPRKATGPGTPATNCAVPPSASSATAPADAPSPSLGVALGMTVLVSTAHPDHDNTAVRFADLDTVIARRRLPLPAHPREATTHRQTHRRDPAARDETHRRPHQHRPRLTRR